MARALTVALATTVRAIVTHTGLDLLGQTCQGPGVLPASPRPGCRPSAQVGGALSVLDLDLTPEEMADVRAILDQPPIVFPGLVQAIESARRLRV
jgi:hypothetical protein